MDLTHGRAAPVDWLLAAFNVIMAGAWALALGEAANAGWMCLAHAAAATLPVLLGAQPRLSRPVAALRFAYPLLWLAAFWTEIDGLRRALHVVANDAVIRSLDVALFRTALHTNLMPSIPSLWVSEPLHFAYFAYYAAIVLPIVALAVQRRHTALNEAYFRLMLTYAVCFTLYAVFPVDGPHHLEPIFAGRPADGFWYQVVHSVNSRGGSLGAAFPSSHAAGAVTIAFLGHLYFGRGVATLLTVHAGMVVVATTYTQYHYAIDSVAGLVLAIVLQAVVAPAMLRDRGAVPIRAPHLPLVPMIRRVVQEGGEP
jgi:membrane-associated phospholipid phosphatase